MKFVFRAILFALLLTFASCNTPKKVPYTVEAEMIPLEKLAELNTITDPVLGPGDLLNIDVRATDMTAVAPFNKSLFVSPSGTISTLNVGTRTSGTSGAATSTEYYLVNSEGEIEFPGIGIIKVSGMSKQELAEKIADYIYPRFTKEKPVVDVRLMNFRITVLGAVGSPGVKVSNNERMNILEAIAMSGDLNIKGDRENILLYRTNSDGSREIHKLNINDRSILMSPYFNLQQNDIIYVVPNKSMQRTAWSVNPYITATFTYVGGLSSIIALVVSIINLAK